MVMMRSGVAQVEAPLDADKPLGHAVRRELLLRICCGQLTEMLNDRRLTPFEICQAPPDPAERALDVRNIRAIGAELHQHQIVRAIDACGACSPKKGDR